MPLSDLTVNGYVIGSCFEGEEAYEYLLHGEYGGAILEAIPHKDCVVCCLNDFEVLERIRSKGIQTSVLFLTARGLKKDIIHELDFYLHLLRTSIR